MTGSSSPHFYRLAIWCLFGLAAFGAAGCEQVMQTAPTSSVLMLTASASAVDLNSSLPIVATVVDGDGKAVNDGTLVTFATTLGRLEPAEARVANGRATVHLVAGTTSGVASITAASGTISSNALTIWVGSVPSRIVMTASTGAAGAASIVATVFDQHGVAVPGVPITFTASTGTLGSAYVYTDQFGQASTTLYTATEAVVTAEALGVRSTISVRPTGSGTIAVNIGMSPTAPVRNQTIVFTATVAGYNNQTVPVQRYEWDWGGGYVVVTTGNTTSRSFEFEGNYGVTVRVIGVDGSVGVSRIEFYVD